MPRLVPLLAALLCLSLAADAQRGDRRIKVARKEGAPIRTATAHLSYWGGHVIPNVKVYQVLWTASTQPDMSGFFGSVTNSNYMDWLEEYDTNIKANAGSKSGSEGTDQLIGRGTFGGKFTITPSAGNAGGKSACTGGNVVNCCLPDAPSGFTCIDDLQVSDELQQQIAAGHLPPNDENSLYFVYFTPSIVVGQGGTSACQVGSFCAYHGTLATSDAFNLYYAVMPDFSASGPGCDTGCGKSTDTILEKLQEVSSHEMIEAVTDAEVGIGTTLDFPLGWYDANNGESADICDGNFATVGSFSVQQIWSNSKGGCTANHPAATDFNVALGASSKTVTAGGAGATVSLTSATVAGSAQSLTLTVNAPAGITANFDTTSISSGNGATLNVSADSGTGPAVDQVVQVAATNGSITHTASVLVQVLPEVVGADDFSLGVVPGSQVIAPGSSADYTVTSTLASGSSESVVLTIGALPAGVHGTWASSGTATGSPVDSDGGSDTLTLSVDGGAADVAATSFSIKGTSASVPLGHSITATVAVATASDFSLTISPTSAQTMASSGTKQFTITAHGVGSPANIDLTVDGLPSGVTGAFDNTPIQPGESATLTLTASGAPASSATIFTVTGTDDEGLARAATGSIEVLAGNDFGISLSSGTVSLARGTQTSLTVSTTASGGAGSIALSAGGLPGGVTASFSPASVIAGSGSTLTLTASSAAPITSTASFSVTGTSGSIVHSATATISVTGTPGRPTLSFPHLSSGATLSGASQEIDLTATPAAGSTLQTVALSVTDSTNHTTSIPPPAGASLPATTFFWNTTQFADGAYTLTAIATDADTGSATATLSVTVDNSGSGPGGPGGGGSGCSSFTGAPAGALGLLGLFALRRRKR